MQNEAFAHATRAAPPSTTILRASRSRSHGSEAVFLDSWGIPQWMEGRTLADLRREMSDEFEEEGEVWWALYSRVQPAYTLYCVGSDGVREDLSEAHETPERDENGEYLRPAPSLREMLPEELRAGFSSTVCGAHPKQRLVQVSPEGGTLVIFDTAVVPHEATKVVAGQRLALFGFFAEAKQLPRAWADPEGEVRERSSRYSLRSPFFIEEISAAT